MSVGVCDRSVLCPSWCRCMGRPILTWMLALLLVKIEYSTPYAAVLTCSIACLQVRAEIAMTTAGMTLYHVVPSRSCRVLWLLNVSQAAQYPLHILRRVPAHLPPCIDATCMRRIIACNASLVKAFSAGDIAGARSAGEPD
jgi:hypothetical protein